MDFEFSSARVLADIRRSPVRRFVEREGLNWTAGACRGFRDVGAGGVNRERAIGGERFRKFPEGSDGVIEGSEVIEVVGFDAEDDAVDGGELEEVAAVFAAFGDEVESRAEASTPMIWVSRFRTDDDGGIPTGGEEEVGEDGGGGALAVGAGDDESASITHQEAEQIIVRDLVDSEFGGANAFGVAGRNRGAVDQELSFLGESAGVMSGSELDSPRGERSGTGNGDFILIGAGDGPTGIGEVFREGLHA